MHCFLIDILSFGVLIPVWFPVLNFLVGSSLILCGPDIEHFGLLA